LLAVLAKLQHGKGAAEVAALLRKRQTRVRVSAEYRYSIEGAENRSGARNDIRIEMHNGNEAALIVIENKINAPEGEELNWSGLFNALYI